MKRIRIIWSCWIIVGAAGCKEIYRPAIISSPHSYLVVEGVLNAGTGPTSIRVTRTIKLDDATQIRAERNAVVTVEGRDNSVKTLPMTGDGEYFSPFLDLTVEQEYRLRVKTAGGKEYLSSFVTARLTPAIDSLRFERQEKGVEVQLNTHDDRDETRYYRWEYDETWEIRSYYFSFYRFSTPEKVIERQLPAEDVSVCWKYNSSKNIILGSSARLASDIIYRAPMVFIPNGDEKLAVRYSMLVRQYAMDKEGYAYYELMKKNTESLGTIFDAQPSEFKGNISNVADPQEPVIGYVSASTIEEKRFFINVSQLNNWRFYEDCPLNSVPNDPGELRKAYQGGISVITAMYPDFGIIPVAYYSSYKRCVECPARGGALQKPLYW